jgi:BASS family bile acid:Na+ symporter
METIRLLLPFIIAGSLGALIVAVGLQATLDDLLYLFRRPILLLKAIVSVNVLVPLAAVIIVSFLPLEPAVKAGIILMSISPVPPLVPGGALKAGAERSYLFGLYFALVAVSLVLVPATVAVLGRVYAVEASLPMGALLRTVLLGVLAPLAIGLAVRRFAPAFAERAAPILRRVAMVLLVLVVLPILIKLWPTLMSFIGNGTLFAMIAICLVGLTAGHLLGGPELPNRAALAVSSATRHPGIALMIAGINFDDKAITAAIILFMLTQVATAIPYKLWVKRQA